MADKKWIDDATKNAHGQFAAKAKERGMTTRQIAAAVLRNPGKYDAKTRKQAGLAHTLMAMGK
jgi:hypothetical protein